MALLSSFCHKPFQLTSQTIWRNLASRARSPHSLKKKGKKKPPRSQDGKFFKKIFEKYLKLSGKSFKNRQKFSKFPWISFCLFFRPHFFAPILSVRHIFFFA
jgi:hypothetical protein